MIAVLAAALAGAAPAPATAPAPIPTVVARQASGAVPVNADTIVTVDLRVAGDAAVLMIAPAGGEAVPYLAIGSVAEALAVLADRRLAFAWPLVLDWAGPDLVALRDRALARAAQADAVGLPANQPRGQAEQYSGSFATTATLSYAAALSAAGRRDAAVALLRTRLAASREADALQHRDGAASAFLGVRLASYIRDGDGEGDAEAVAMLAELADDPTIAAGFRLNALVNLARIEAETGRSAAALDHVTRALATFRGQTDAAGDAVKVPDSEANFAWIEACALHGLGRGAEAARRMASIEVKPGTGTQSSTTQTARRAGYLCQRDAAGYARAVADDLAHAAPGGSIFLAAQPLSFTAAADRDVVRRAVAEPVLADALATRARLLPDTLAAAVSDWRGPGTLRPGAAAVPDAPATRP